MAVVFCSGFFFVFFLSTTIAVSSYVLNAPLWGSSSWLDLAALELDSCVVDCWMRSKAPVFMDQWLSDYNIRFGLFGRLMLKRPCQFSIPKPPHLVFFFTSYTQANNQDAGRFISRREKRTRCWRVIREESFQLRDLGHQIWGFYKGNISVMSGTCMRLTHNAVGWANS